MAEALSDSSNLQEVLWNFCLFKDKRLLTLMDNPHFYTDLPTSPEAYGGSFKIDSTDDFRHADKFYVLIDKPELVYIMTDQVSQSFGNFWRPQNAIVFRGLGIDQRFFTIFDGFPDICGRLRGETIVKASLRGSCCWFCKRPLVPTFPSDITNCRGLKPIITEGYPPMTWECLISCCSADSSVGFDLCVYTGRAAPNSPVCCDVSSTYTTSANLEIASSPVATDVRETGVQRVVQGTYPYT